MSYLRMQKRADEIVGSLQSEGYTILSDVKANYDTRYTRFILLRNNFNKNVMRVRCVRSIIELIKNGRIVKTESF